MFSVNLQNKDKSSELKNRVKDYGIIFRVDRSDVFYFVSNTELITRDDLSI